MIHSLYASELSNIVSKVAPQRLYESKLQLLNKSLFEQLSLSDDMQNEEHLLRALFDADGQFAQQSVAQKYGGHQFGQWNPDIGDGRGLLLGEVTDSTGNLQDLHLKGAGKTPYSRFGDGRAVLRSTIREYVISESLHALGVPTSRALCLLSSKHPVQRETLEKGAMMIRVCPSHIRFGHFEYYYHTKDWSNLDALFEFTFRHHYPQCAASENPHLAFLHQVVKDTAYLIAHWQTVGFCHGVMNTDNMSIHGISFDFGPFAFLDAFIPDYVCNHSDHAGRYAFDQQPGVALWNLQAFSQAFFRYLDEVDIRDALQQFEPHLIGQYQANMQRKFGWCEQQDNDHQLVNDFLRQLSTERTDYTNSFRTLSSVCLDADNRQFHELFEDKDWSAQWLSLYLARCQAEAQSEELRITQMKMTNPAYIPRNYLLQQVIEAAELDNFQPLEQLVEVMTHPFDDKPDWQTYGLAPAAEQIAKPLSCSS